MDTLLRGAVLSYNRQEIVRPNLNDDPGAPGARVIVRPNGTRIPCAGGASDNSRWEARRSRARPPDGQRGRNIRPGGAAEPTRDKILLRPCRGGSVFGGRSFTGGCARLRLASHRLFSVAPSGAGEHHDNLVQLPARKCPAREDGPSPESVVPGHSLPGSCTKIVRCFYVEIEVSR